MNLSIFTIFSRVHRPFQAARRSLSVSKKFLQTCSVLSLLSNIFHFLVLVNVCSPVSLSWLHRGAEDGFSFTNRFPVKATFLILGLIHKSEFFCKSLQSQSRQLYNVWFLYLNIQSLPTFILDSIDILEVVIAINRSYPYRQLPYRLPTGIKLNLLSLRFTSTSLHNWLQKEPKK